MPTFIKVIVDSESGVRQILLNHPEKKNALSLAMLAELEQVLHDDWSAPKGGQAMPIVITGGDRMFGAGASLDNLAGTVEDLAMDEAVERVVAAIQNIPAPVIAAVEGFCIGAAVDLCLACDVRIGSSTSVLQIPATQLGILYNPKAVNRWSRLISQDALARLLVFGECFDAQEAWRVGLLSKVVAAGQAIPSAIELASANMQNDNDASSESIRLVRSVYSERFDPEIWQPTRERLLDAPRRARALRRKKNSIRNRSKAVDGS